MKRSVCDVLCYGSDTIWSASIVVIINWKCDGRANIQIEQTAVT